MARYWQLVIVSTVLWSTAVALMVGGTLRQSLIIMGWGGFTALVACIVTGWLVAIGAATTAAHRERVDVQDLAKIMARCASEEAATTRIR